ncbi:HIG1 domain-containing protein [Trichostrongylus colubriformis]|uniref:HIG1 domain-containing protein n=1 Tax=Trichostrongylus colubriformis TaxID=6319 RepID=A0AAN8GA07_TRICO
MCSKFALFSTVRRIFFKMGIFRKVFMSAAGIHEEKQESRKGSYEWKKEHLTPEQLKRTSDNQGRFSGIPAIPSDIGYSSGKETGGKKKSGVVSQAASNPGVILGMGLTCLALLGMFKSSFVGDKLGAQKFMRYRIMAQFFTVTALVAGVTLFGATYEDEDVKQKPAHAAA